MAMTTEKSDERLQAAMNTEITKTEIGLCAVTRLDGPNELFALKQMAGRPHCEDYASWGTKDREWERIANRLIEGDGDPKIAALIEKRTAEMSAMMTMGESHEMAPCGGYPIVAAAVAGDPFSMKHRTTDMSASAPLKLWFPMSVSQGVTGDAYAEMISLAAALAITLSEIRPVELVSYSLIQCHLPGGAGNRMRGTDAHMITCPIPTESMDARSMASWCDVWVGRVLHMAISAQAFPGFSGGWGFRKYPDSATSAPLKAARLAVDADDTDVFIPPGFSRNNLEEFRKQAIALAEQSGCTLTLETNDKA
jgi:hypothetical protein